MAHFYISSVRAKAFKNISSQWVEVQFRQGLNAVVGPNGCGKSSLLEAICFAFAAPAKTFNVAALSELQNTDTDEVCEVHVKLATSRASTVHTVAACLCPDGSRSFKVNGKSKSGKELKEFLRGLGICLDSAGAVVKQAQVTRMADLNSPTELAAVVADASGLGRWNQERRLATEELTRTSQAIATVQRQLQTLELSLGEDAKALKALQRLEAIDREVEALAQEGGAKLGAGLAQCSAQLAEAAQTMSALQGEQAAGEQRLRALEARRDEVAEALAAVDDNTASDASSSRQRAVLQEEVAILQRQLEVYEQQRRKLEDYQAAAKRSQAQLDRISSLLPAAIAGHTGAVPAAMDVTECTELLKQLAKEKEGLEQMLSSLSAGAAACPEITLEQVSAVEAAAAALRHDLSKAQSAYHLQLSQLGPAASRGSTPACRPLHLCFQFTSPGDCSGLAAALEVIAGRFLNTYVADDVRTASECLGSLGGSARVWAADCLSPPDNRQRFKKAAATFQPGEVIAPTDLLAYDPKYQSAMLRAFGGYVIAKTSQVASLLIEKFDIPSITLDGRVSQKGSLQGGWSPDQQRGSSRMETKLRCDAQLSALQSLEQELRRLDVQVQQLQQGYAQQQQSASARAQAESQLRDVEEQMAACSLELHVHALSGSSLAELQAQLRQVQRELKEHLQAAESLEGEMAGCDPEQLQADVRAKQTEVGHLEQSMQKAQEAAQKQAAEHEALREQAREVQQQLDACRSAASSLAQQLQEAQQLHKDVSRVQAQLQIMQAELGGSTELGAPSEDGPAVPQPLAAADLAWLLKECSQNCKAVARLQAEKAALECSGAAALVEERCRARQAAHQEHLSQLGVLQKAVAALEEYIRGSNGRVVQTNNVTAASIVSLFTSLCSEILPKLRFQLEQQGADAHDGLLLRYAPAGASSSTDWQASLDALSGGQRTLVSLAFILASHIVGTRCNVLLMDEVDAALDEANQHLVGRLINHMLSAASASCAQVLCVSHNSALQELCHVVSLRPSASKRARR